MIPKSTWAEIRTAHASGIGLREIARNMGIAPGTVLSRAKREGWSAQIQTARALVPVASSAPTIAPADAAALTMQQRGQRHVERMAGVVERTLPAVETMQPENILDRIEDIDRLDKIGRRTYGLDEAGSGGPTAINFLSYQTLIQPIERNQ